MKSAAEWRRLSLEEPALAETSWPMPDPGGLCGDSIEHHLRFGTPDRRTMLAAAEIVAAYGALIEGGTTTQQVKRLAALRRMAKRTP
jgi:hypothetical protein